ncbi:MAG: hypothetical protein JXB30_11205 [Anaerolineae bacterium]|nr:hypothetical protein [Anaerolineae bacterium]
MLLDKKGVSNRLYCEGDLDHPADFEAVAHFTRPDYEVFVSRHAAYRQVLEHNVTVNDTDYFLAYRKIKSKNGQMPPGKLIDELARYDVYETPLASTYCRLAAQRWQEFVNQAVLNEETSVFECCFLQNPLTVLIGKHNVCVSDAIEHVQMVNTTIQPLQPAVIYLRQPDVRTTLERVSRERPREWKDFLITYFTRQGWGKATGAKGFDGVCAFYEMRQQIELALLQHLEIAKLLIENTSYNRDECQRAIDAFVSALFNTA